MVCTNSQMMYGKYHGSWIWRKQFVLIFIIIYEEGSSVIAHHMRIIWNLLKPCLVCLTVLFISLLLSFRYYSNLRMPFKGKHHLHVDLIMVISIGNRQPRSVPTFCQYREANPCFILHLRTNQTNKIRFESRGVLLKAICYR